MQTTGSILVFVTGEGKGLCVARGLQMSGMSKIITEKYLARYCFVSAVTGGCHIQSGH